VDWQAIVVIPVAMLQLWTTKLVAGAVIPVRAAVLEDGEEERGVDLVADFAR
jgi:hypothetical protein